MFRAFLASSLVVLSLPAGAQDATPPATPEISESYRLTVMGGPVAVDVDVFLNDEYALTLTERNEWFHDIPGLLKPGANVLKVVAKAPGEPRTGSEPLEIQLRRVKLSGRRVETSGQPLASLTIPAALDASGGCEETVRFFVDPSPKPNPALKNRWYLLVGGPATEHQVTVLVNGNPVWSGTEGDAIVEISGHLTKGKNAVTFEGRPTCLAQSPQGRELLFLQIAPARLEGDSLQQTEVAAASFELGRDRKGESFSVQRPFRAW